MSEKADQCFETELLTEKYKFLWKISNLPFMIKFKDTVGAQKLPINWKEHSVWELSAESHKTTTNEKGIVIKFYITLKETLASRDNMLIGVELTIHNQDGKELDKVESNPTEFEHGKPQYIGISTFMLPPGEEVIIVKGKITVHSATLKTMDTPPACKRPRWGLSRLFSRSKSGDDYHCLK